MTGPYSPNGSFLLLLLLYLSYLYFVCFNIIIIIIIIIIIALVQTLVHATPGFQPEVGISNGARLNMNPDPIATMALDNKDVEILSRGLSKYGQWGLRSGTANQRPLSRSQGWTNESKLMINDLNTMEMQSPLYINTTMNKKKAPFGGSGIQEKYTIGAGFRGPQLQCQRKNTIQYSDSVLNDSIDSIQAIDALYETTYDTYNTIDNNKDTNDEEYSSMLPISVLYGHRNEYNTNTNTKHNNQSNPLSK